MSSVICDKLPTPTQHGDDKKGPHKDTTGGDTKGSYKDSTDVNWPSLAGCVLTAGLEIVLRCLRVGASCGQLTEMLIALTQFQMVHKPNLALLLLSELLATPSLAYHPRLFTLARLVVEACPNWSNRLCLASLVKPVLQFLALPNNKLCYGKSKNLATLKTRAGQLLVGIEEKLKHATTTDKSEEISPASYCLGSTGYNCQLASELCQNLVAPACKSPDLTQSAWLNNVSSSLDKPESCTLVLNHLISAILISTSSTDVLHSGLAAITKLARLDPVQAPDFLPLILYVLGKSQDPEVKLQLLEAIPQLATHKFCIPPVLKTIQALSRSEDLKAVSIRLLVLLWKQQDRCFPQLLQAISDPHPVQTGSPVNLILLAKASAILDICKYKPEQYGAQLLAPLSDLLSAATSEAETAVSVLALEGLYLLCEAEVIDIQSLWAVLGEQCTQEKRPLVVTRICRLLSLVPRLKVKTDEYEVFTQGTLIILWMHSQSHLSEVRSAAFHALSQFSGSQFCVSHLPKTVTAELYQQADLVAKQQAEAGDDTVVSVDQMFPQVPGSCYVDILKTVSDGDSIQGYTKFLQSLAHSEAANLPRSVFFSSLRRHGSTQDNSVEMIPNFLLQQYDKCKQPGLRPGLAAGLLFCYDPPLEVGRDGRPRKHYVLRHGKTFLEMFGTLLQEVPVQPSDWHRCALMPQAWSSFMVRLFLSLLESRKADLELQEKHGHILPSDLEEKKVIAWLSTRDSILDVIKASSRGTPAAQANSVMSLAGLALCLHKFVADMEPAQVKAAEGRPEFLCHSHWLAVTYETILSLADGQYTPVGNLHGLCQQVSLCY
ncbi:focadhesin-like [Physella acuta]|uniref:focadhesin-like n=1 Tax=Physella acuta TaxID=109671 RepID=UPI0027DB4465|nr:focadhesin-like [Physella acuta]